MCRHVVFWSHLVSVIKIFFVSRFFFHIEWSRSWMKKKTQNETKWNTLSSWKSTDIHWQEISFRFWNEMKETKKEKKRWFFVSTLFLVHFLPGFDTIDLNEELHLHNYFCEGRRNDEKIKLNWKINWCFH